MFNHASMNRAFKLVWNQARQAFVPVAENVKGHARGGVSKRFTLATITLALLAQAGPGHAQLMPATTVVPVAGSKTNAYISGNGVPIVNINTANGAGVSHNQFTRYDVQANGMVLNNGNTTQAARQSTLAGQVVGNTNLTNEARVILNEVVSTNRSTLNGFTEVLGGKADVIVANPYGITCSGCGFINTDRVTLTTGVPTFGGDGSVAGFAVMRGDVLINGVGLNGSAQQLLDIVTRSVKIDGQINTAAGGTLGITTGTNQWSYSTRTVTGSTTGVDAVPSMAIDSTVLGGMYAGRIRLIATEAGVGVRMLGEAAASVDDFSINSAGKVDIRSAVSAERDLQITSTHGADALGLNNAQLSAKRDLSLSATQGAAAFTGSSIVAGRALQIRAGSLVDQASSSSLSDNNLRFGQTSTLFVTGSAQLAGVKWGALDALHGQAGSLSVDAALGATLYAGSTLDLSAASDLTLAQAAITSVGDLTLSAATGKISTAAGGAQGILSTTGHLTLRAGNGLEHAGAASADAGQVRVFASGTSNNRGTLHAEGDVFMADQEGGSTQTFNNQGTVLAGGSLTIHANVLHNTSSGAMQGSVGTTIAAQVLQNDGLLVASPSGTHHGSFDLGTLSNSATGTIQSAGDLTFNVRESLDNSGLLLAVNDLLVNASGLSTTLSIANQADGIIQARQLTIASLPGTTASITTQAGRLWGQQGMSVSVASLSNSGVMLSGASMGLSASGQISNSGTLQSAGELSIDADSLDNSGLINGATLANQDVFLSVGTLDNRNTGVIQSGRDLSIGLGGALNNSGTLRADQDLDLFTDFERGSASTIDTEVGSFIIAHGALSVLDPTVTVNTQAGAMLANTIDLDVLSLNNSGTIQSDADMTVHILSGGRNDGVLLSGSTLDFSSASYWNNGTLQADGGLTLSAAAFTNSGLIIASGARDVDGTLNVSATFTNTDEGTIQSARDLFFNMGGNFSNDGLVLAQGQLSLMATSALQLSNLSNGIMQAGQQLTLASQGSANWLSIDAQDGALLGSGIAITSTALANSGTIQATHALSINTTGTIDSEGSVLSGGTMSLTAHTVINDGGIQANGGLQLSAQTLTNAGLLIASQTSGTDGTLSVNTLTNTVDGTIQSVRDLTLNVAQGLDNAGLILAGRDLSASASQGGSTLTMVNQADGLIQAGRALSLRGTGSASNLAITSQDGTLLGQSVSITAASLDNAGTVQSSAATTLAIRDTLSNSGTVLAATDLTLTGGALTNTADGTLQGNHGLTLQASSLNNSGVVIAGQGSAHEGHLTLGALTNTSTGVIQSGDKLVVRVTQTLDNSGDLLALAALSIDAASSGTTLAVHNRASGFMQAGGALTLGTTSATNLSLSTQAGTLLGQSVDVHAQSLNNSGWMQSNGTMGLSLAGTLSNTSVGTILADTAMTVGATTVTNIGTLQATQGLGLVATTLSNQGSVIASGSSGHDGSITVSSLSNTGGGVIQSAADLSVSVAQSLTNSASLLADGDLTVTARDAGQTLAVSNQSGGRIQAGGALSIVGTAHADNLSLSTQAGDLIGQSINIKASGLSNAGRIQSDAQTTLAITNALSNSGNILATGTLGVTAASLTNEGGIQSDGGLTLTTPTLTNSGLIVTANGETDGTINVDTLTNQSGGTIEALGGSGAHGLHLNVKSLLSNAGSLIAESNLYAQASDAGTTLSLNNQGLIQAGYLLRLGTGTQLNLSNSAAGEILGVNAVLAAGTLDNLGFLGGTGLTLHATTLNNAGLISPTRGLTIQATTLNNQSTGVIQNATTASGAGTITAAVLNNDGKLNLGQGSDYGTLNLTTLNNRAGALIDSRSVTLSLNVASLVDNAGTIRGDGRVEVKSSSTSQSLDIINRATAVIQAGQDLRLGQLDGDGSPTTMSIQAGQLIAGTQFNIYLSSLTNSGLIQGGLPSSGQTSFIGLTGALVNQSGGRIILANGVSGEDWIAATTITNGGSIESGGNAKFYLGSALTNSGSLVIDGDLTVTDAASSNAAAQYALDNTGRLDVGGALGLSGLQALTIKSGATWVAGAMTLTAPTVTFDNNAMLSTLGNLTLHTGTLSFGGTTSRIVAATSGTGLATIALSSAFTNVGAVHSGGDMLFTAPAVTNSATGGFSALNDLTIKATTSINNLGALYAGRDLWVQTMDPAGSLTNAVTTGTMDAGRDIMLISGNLTNRSSIDSGRNITLDSANLKNEISGYTKTTGSRTALGVNASRTVTVYSPGSSTPDYYEYYDETSYNETVSFAGGVTPPKPTVTASGSILVKGFNTAVNVGGLLAAPTITITGLSPSATFVNDPLRVGVSAYLDTTVYSCVSALICIDGVSGAFAGYQSLRTYLTPILHEPMPGGSVGTSIGAGIYASTLTASGFGLTNLGSPSAASVTPVSTSGITRGIRGLLANAVSGSSLASGSSGGSTSGGLSAVSKSSGISGLAGISGTSLVGGRSGVSGGSAAAGLTGVSGASASSGATPLTEGNKAAGITGTTSASGAPAVTFGGLSITLPNNPNGYYVPARDPNSQFLIETNPLFSVGSNFVGSDYLAKRYGYNPDTAVKRLGDSNYEANLIKQQLVSKTGNNLLKGYANEAAQVQGLMDRAVVQGNKIGLTYGQAPTPAQLSQLASDIVWMVETVVNGTRVLAPVVYLAASTRNAIDLGGVISGTDVNLNVTSLTNTGGTISGSNTLAITSKGDVTNTSGTIRGGAVSVVSTQGSIINRTASATVGTSNGSRTVVGKTATISATNSLVLDAKKDITVKGAQVSSLGSATLKAGQNITFDTIEDRSTSTTTTTTKSKGKKTTETTSTTTVKQVKSGLTVGGTLNAAAGNDLTLAGTDVKVGGGASLTAGNNVNIVARANTTETSSSSSTKATGAFSSLKGSSTTQTNSLQSRNVGSTLDIGGNAIVSAGKTTTIQGSNLNVAGSASITGQDVKILAGQDVDTSTSTTNKKKVMSATSGGLAFAEKTGTTTDKTKSTSVGTNIKVGGSLGIEANNNVTVQGSNVTAGKDLSVSAQSVDVLAARNVDTTTTTSTTKSVGMFFDSNNKATKEGEAKGSKQQGAQGSVEAKAGLNSQNNMDVVRQSTTTTTTTDVTNTGSQLSGGGVVVIKAKDKVTVQGSDISGDEGVSVKGKNIEFLAAQDSHTTTTTSTTTSAGVYVDGKANAEGSAKGGVGGEGNGALVKGEAQAKGSAGVQVRESTQTNTQGSTTARVSTITSKSGDIIREADEGIKDVGTAIDAGGRFVQKATTIDSQAAANTTFDSSSTDSKSARAGGFAGVESKASYGAYAGSNAQGGGSGVGSGNQSGAGRGIEVQVTKDSSRSANTNSTAVVSTVKAGGGISSTSTGKTTLEGTKFETLGDVDIGASSLDFKAARNTQSSRSNDTSLNVGAEIGKKDVTLTGARETAGDQYQASQAVAGEIKSGGNVNIRTSGDTRLEGTQVKAKGDTTVAAGGNLNIEAARDEMSYESNSDAVGGSVQVGRGKGNREVKGGSVEASMGSNSASSSEAKGASIESGGAVKLSAGKNATLEGTDLSAGKGAEVNAGGKVDIKAAESRQSESEFSAEISGSAEKGEGKGKGGKASSKGGGDDKGGSKSVVSAEMNGSSNTTSQTREGTVKTGTEGLKVNGQVQQPAAPAEGTAKADAPEQADLTAEQLKAKAKAKKVKKKTTVQAVPAPKPTTR